MKQKIHLPVYYLCTCGCVCMYKGKEDNMVEYMY